ncbi:hypothetical protein TD95_003500 [Thielaviopsis punctulata]|uniref:Rab-GAP TBC domain-containing protein n=1 Tax=Thielaviopsis punctulata TaxID=72032 RepID=A0A0F4ZKS7_9PEZI|nr:hypothetical protein TD95_003500 [Thielaviopsis punctulata]
MATSKSSSRASAPFDDASTADASNFEDIALQDASLTPVRPHHGARDVSATRSVASSHHDNSPTSDTTSVSPSKPANGTRQLTAPGLNKVRNSAPPPTSSNPHGRKRPELLSLRSHIRQANMNANFRNTNTGNLTALGSPGSRPPISPGARSATLPMRQHSQSRSRSPSLHDDSSFILKPRRTSWQPNQSRKSSIELEQEFDEDDGADIPEGLILDNVPLSPRPLSERSNSRRSSRGPTSPSPSRSKTRPAGNGTPAVATAHGSLKSPGWKSDSGLDEIASTNSEPTPMKTRARSWNLAMSELSPEARMLTEKLEEHQDSTRAERPATWGSSRQSLDTMVQERNRQRKKSPLPELPPLRKSDAMIDPLPVSKEKEAVLSRTRPSWLPPKDPEEEKRHLREYQKMMAKSMEAERKREAAKAANKVRRDSNAENTMRTWEDDIIPRWPDAIRERKTRELWWRGVAPRSRGIVWARAIGNELGLTGGSFDAALKRAREAEARVADGKGDSEDARRVEWFAAARHDVEEKTWMELKIFQKGGPLHENLVNLLCAYAMYRGDIGYVSGCNTIAALLLLNLPNVTDAFVALANVLNRPVPLSFFTCDEGAKASAYTLVHKTLKERSRPLHDHIVSLSNAAAAASQSSGDMSIPHGPDAYLRHVFTGLFTSCLAIDEAARLWDVYVFEGDTAIVRAAIALMIRNEGDLLVCKTLQDVTDVLDGVKKPRKIVADVGAEDKWMKLVREAGKA